MTRDSDLQALAARIRELTKDWPKSMLDPAPGTDPAFDRIVGRVPAQEGVCYCGRHS